MAHRTTPQPNRTLRACGAALILAAALAGCAAPKTGEEVPPAGQPAAVARQGHVPAFARVPYVPFSRTEVVAIALREWRLFGELVDDDPPGTRPPPEPDQKPERMPGLWERVGEYWWIGQDADRVEGAWTGRHDEDGHDFPAEKDAYYAWSAAFVSYVMRIAGAGPRFPYGQAHWPYINVAREMSLGQTTGWVIFAELPDAYAPQPGDLICESRSARPVRFDDLPTAHGFAAHCDIVVKTNDMLTVVGGNVDDAVTMKHVPVTLDGKLAPPGGRPVDDRYPWFVVLRVLYDTPPGVADGATGRPPPSQPARRAEDVTVAGAGGML